MPPATAFLAHFPSPNSSSPRGFVPPSSPPFSLFHHFAPFGLSLTAALLLLCVLRILLRKCQNRLFLFWRCRQSPVRCSSDLRHPPIWHTHRSVDENLDFDGPTATGGVSDRPFSPFPDQSSFDQPPYCSGQSLCRCSASALPSDASSAAVSPLFFLHQSADFLPFPLPFSHPLFRLFFLQNVLPLPPKYDDALKLPLPQPLTERRPPQRISSPPPSYEQIGQIGAIARERQQQTLVGRTGGQRRAPLHFGSVGDIPSVSAAVGPSGDHCQNESLANTTNYGGGALSDRPCSSLSPVEEANTMPKRQLRIFVAKSARKMAEKRREKVKGQRGKTRGEKGNEKDEMEEEKSKGEGRKETENGRRENEIREEMEKGRREKGIGEETEDGKREKERDETEDGKGEGGRRKGKRNGRKKKRR
ncbi:hypothetical protein niasHS_010955 [Heterodera schachtii]|uniref:Uncharacterized protein n=1 Tax=Heterodera schachtii TaxID=97005 RepID=A0ABD2J3J8_HETSC